MSAGGEVKKSQGSIRIESRPQMQAQFKKKANGVVKDKTGILMDAPDPIGKGDNTLKGDICKRLLGEERKREVLVSLVPSMHQHSTVLLRCSAGGFVGNFTCLII